ncbi:MAG: polyphosphate polymerase domain-containing protein [Myxococcus sp.]|nr:polyphosphate polymerase domain-containing protein [Myxococcus sp.]
MLREAAKPAGSSTESFERFEYKFWAPREAVDRVLRLLDGEMEQDAVALRTEASQVNTSLYFDSPHFTFLEQHVSGSPDRIKLRVRYYGDAPRAECFFEIKRRQNAVVMKRRAVLPLDLSREVVRDVSRPLPVQNAALNTFQYLAVRCQATPKLLVRARRLALRAIDRRLDTRLTVDDDMAWQPVSGSGHDALTPDPARWRRLPSGSDGSRVLVEVKYRDERPWWLGQVVRGLSAFRLSFSKYVSAALSARHDPFFTMDRL